jgi:hypothetical protein
MNAGLFSGSEYLAEKAMEYFRDKYQILKFDIDSKLARNLRCEPTFGFRVHDHLTIVVEVSESPYPAIFRMRSNEIADADVPVAAYSVCSEAAFLSDQSAARELVSHGFGLITVDDEGYVERWASPGPLMQRIGPNQFNAESSKLPRAIRRRVAEAFERYQNDPLSGVKDLTEIIEGVVYKSGNECVKKGWVARSKVKPGYTANTLDEIEKTTQFAPQKAIIGGIRNYVASYRNTVHHWPKDQKQAARKYRDCRHAFLDGLKQLKAYSDAVRTVGLSGSL